VGVLSTEQTFVSPVDRKIRLNGDRAAFWTAIRRGAEVVTAHQTLATPPPLTPASPSSQPYDRRNFQHPNSEISATDPFFIMLNYAIGGINGWETDLARYGSQIDMWIN